MGSTSGFFDKLSASVKTSSISQLFVSSQEDRISHTEKEMLSGGSKHPTANAVNESEPDPPDKVIYFILFNNLVGLKTRSEQAQAEGGPQPDYYGLYEKQANLNISESQFLFQTAQDCLNAIKPIDEQAKSIIDAARASFPAGEVPDLKNMPPPPAELITLQQQKDAVILQYRDSLRNS